MARVLKRAAPLIIPAPVTTEIDVMLRQRGGSENGQSHLARHCRRPVPGGVLDGDEHGLALTLHQRYAAFDLGLADLSVVVLAHRFRTSRILTLDERHFRAITPLEGGFFTILPRSTSGSAARPIPWAA